MVGFIVSRGSTLLGGGQKMVFGASSVHSVGPDAVTVKAVTLEHAEGTFPGLPRRRDIVGRKIVGHGGKMYGHIHDVLVDETNGQLIGYTVEDSPVRGLDSLFGTQRTGPTRYVRADADMGVGTELVVVPDEAVVTMDTAPHLVSPDGSGAVAGWPVDGPREAGRPSVWVDQRLQPIASAAVHPAVAPLVPLAAPSPTATEMAYAEPSYEELAFGTAPASPVPLEGEVPRG